MWYNAEFTHCYTPHWRGTMATKNCVICGKLFTHRGKMERYCCSASCGGKYRAEAKRAAGTMIMPVKPRRGDEIPCVTCGKLFYRGPGEIRRGRKTCSKACADVAKVKTPVVKDCEYCGKEMRLKPSQAGIRYCSKLCDGLGRTKRPMERMHNGKAARQDRQGYVMVWQPDHPNKSFHGWQYEHRLVAEQTVGRYLRSDEHVHHINGVKHDNAIENLAVMDGVDHAILSSIAYREWVKTQLAELDAYRARYGPLPEE